MSCWETTKDVWLKQNKSTSPACPKDTLEEKMWKHEDISEWENNFHGKHSSPLAASALLPTVTGSWNN